MIHTADKTFNPSMQLIDDSGEFVFISSLKFDRTENSFKTLFNLIE